MVTTSNYREIIYNNPQFTIDYPFLQKSKQKNWEGMCLLLSPNTNWRRCCCTKPCSAFAAQCSVWAKSAVEADQSSANARLYLRTCTTVLLSYTLVENPKVILMEFLQYIWLSDKQEHIQKIRFRPNQLLKRINLVEIQAFTYAHCAELQVAHWLKNLKVIIVEICFVTEET